MLYWQTLCYLIIKLNLNCSVCVIVILTKLAYITCWMGVSWPVVKWPLNWVCSCALSQTKGGGWTLLALWKCMETIIWQDVVSFILSEKVDASIVTVAVTATSFAGLSGKIFNGEANLFTRVAKIFSWLFLFHKLNILWIHGHGFARLAVMMIIVRSHPTLHCLSTLHLSCHLGCHSVSRSSLRQRLLFHRRRASFRLILKSTGTYLTGLYLLFSVPDCTSSFLGSLCVNCKCVHPYHRQEDPRCVRDSAHDR